MKKIYSNNIIIFCLGLASTFMLFFPCLINDATNEAYTGIQILSGTVISDSDSMYFIIRFDPDVFSFVAFIFPAIAGLMSLLFNNKIVTTISSIMFSLSTVLLFSFPICINVIYILISSASDYYATWSFAGALLIAASLSLLATLLNFRKLELLNKVQ